MKRPRRREDHASSTQNTATVNNITLSLIVFSTLNESWPEIWMVYVTLHTNPSRQRLTLRRKPAETHISSQWRGCRTHCFRWTKSETTTPKHAQTRHEPASLVTNCTISGIDRLKEETNKAWIASFNLLKIWALIIFSSKLQNNVFDSSSLCGTFWFESAPNKTKRFE